MKLNAIIQEIRVGGDERSMKLTWNAKGRDDDRHVILIGEFESMGPTSHIYGTVAVYWDCGRYMVKGHAGTGNALTTEHVEHGTDCFFVSVSAEESEHLMVQAQIIVEGIVEEISGKQVGIICFGCHKRLDEPKYGGQLCLECQSFKAQISEMVDKALSREDAPCQR